MANTILIKRSGTASAVPVAGDLTLGELSLNYTDGKLYFKNSGNVVTLLANANTVAATSLTNGTSNVIVASNANITVGVASTTVATFASTGLILPGIVSVTGNITGGNLNATGLSLSGNVVSALNVTANIAGGNITTPGLISAAGNITGGNVLGGANVNATLHSGTTVSITGTVTAASVVGGVITGSSVSVTGTQTAASTVGGVITGSSASVTGNVTGGNLITAGLASVTGNVNIGNATGVTWANAGGVRVWTYYNNTTASLDTVFL